MSKNFKDLLTTDERFDPSEVVVFRHAPWIGPKIEKQKENWRRMAKEKPKLFNKYQETQVVEKVNDMLSKACHVAAFIGYGRGKARFVGLYEKKGGPHKTTVGECRKKMKLPSETGHPAIFAEMAKFEIRNDGDYFTEDHKTAVFQYDLHLMEDFYPDCRGEMIIEWNCGDRNWYRWAQEGFPVASP